MKMIVNDDFKSLFVVSMLVLDSQRDWSELEVIVQTSCISREAIQGRLRRDLRSCEALRTGAATQVVAICLVESLVDLIEQLLALDALEQLHVLPRIRVQIVQVLDVVDSLSLFW